MTRKPLHVRMKALVLLAPCAFAALAASAIPRPAARDQASTDVDSYVASQLKEQHIPGLALAVIREGQIVKAQGYGLANVELDVPVKPETVFQTGSVGKQFTATAVMMLVEEGKVGLDDHISKYFPNAPGAWNAITVRNLLTHTSGIPDHTEKVINLHSNTGYVILGILIRKVTGQFYGDFLHERIFEPLGMSTTRIISEADIVPNRAARYRLVKSALKNQEWVSPTLNTTADGALYTNVLDMCKWDAGLRTEKLLKKSSFDQMWTPVTLTSGKTYHYGFGWEVLQIGGHRLYQHGGAWQGFTTFIARYVDDGLTVIVLTNLDSEHSNPGKIARRIAGVYVPSLAAGAN